MVAVLEVPTDRAQRQRPHAHARQPFADPGGCPVDRVKALFHWLEETFHTPSRLADYLKSRGIKGQQGCATACPLHELAAQELPGVQLVVRPNTASVLMADGNWWNLSTPWVMAEFITCFDQGSFPWLEA